MRLFLLLLLSLSLFGRDNPFFPANENDKKITTSNKIEILKPYTTQTIALPNSARAIKAVIIRYQNLDGSIKEEEVVLNNSIDWHEPFILSHKSPSKKSNTKKRKVKTIVSDFISFTIDKKILRIHTKDKLLQNFLLTSPHRVVLDFKRETSFKPKIYSLKKAPFTKIRMGNHDGYYRVVIELDGQYRYKLDSSKEDYTVVCY